MSFFGLGYLPLAPGTWGSLGAMVVYVVLFFTLGGEFPVWLLPVLIGTACVVSLGLGGWAVAFYRSGDPRPVVIDEVAGMWVSLLFLPTGSDATRNAGVWAAAFVLFRVFDILKLPPARQLERLPTGAGILCDDLVAGVQTNLVVQVIFRLLWRAN